MDDSFYLTLVTSFTFDLFEYFNRLRNKCTYSKNSIQKLSQKISRLANNLDYGILTPLTVLLLEVLPFADFKTVNNEDKIIYLALFGIKTFVTSVNSERNLN